MTSPKKSTKKSFRSSIRLNKLRTHQKIIIAVIFILVFAIVGGYIILISRAAGTATLALSPASQSISLGSPLTVTIQENSGTDTVNAIEADLTYDQTRLQFVSIVPTSPFNTIVVQRSGGNGVVNFSAATSPAVSGLQNGATVTFNTIGTGTTLINFASTSAIVRSTDTTNILSTTTGGSYTISDMTIPTIPTGLTMASHTITSISLSWTASTDNVGVTGYKIYRNGTQAGTNTTNSFTDSGLTPNTSYSYTVAAYDAAGNNSAQTAAVPISTLADTTAPTTPTGLAISNRTFTSISLSWTASTDNVGVTGYRVYRNGTLAGTSTTTSFTDSGLTSGTSYSYTVAAYDAAGNNSAQSTASSFSTASKPGDINGDGYVNATDLSILATYYGKSAMTRSQGDLNSDGVVNVFDLSILATYWGT
jgi:chitodextrinase